MKTKEIYLFEGNEFKRGTHGVPEYYKNSNMNKPEDWFWQVGKKKDDNCFLPAYMFIKRNEQKTNSN